MTVVAAGPFPDELLVGARSALFLFGAAFLGANDAVWALNAGVRSTVVDRDAERLEEMRTLYPASWRFVGEDVFEFIASASRRWDVVTADPFTGDTADRCLAMLPAFARITNDTLIVTISSRVPSPKVAGWKVSRMPRTRLADWLVLTR